MNNCTNRHNSIPIKNAIAVILAVAFLFTGAIVCPDQIDNTKLAPPSQLSSEGFKYSLTVGAICKYIERDGNLGNGSGLNDVLARLGADKSHSITVLPHEIIIEVPNERVAIRYLDPSKANIITPYSDISRLSTKIIGPSLLRQIIHRVNTLPRGTAEVKFTAAYLDELKNRLLELEVTHRVADEIINVLSQNLKDEEDQWFYSRLVRLTGMADIRQTGRATRQYHGKVEFTKNNGQLRRLINAATPVYQFDKDGTLDKTNTELKAESAHRLASLIIHGRKVGINTARSLQELNKGKDPDTGAPRELYANLREAVIAGIAKEGWDVGPETVADELLIDLFELFLDIGATRLTPRLGAQSQSDLVIDADFQRGCPEKLAEKLQYMLTEKGRSFHHSTIYHIIQMAWRRLHANGLFKNEYGPPVLICHSMPIPKGHPLAEEFGTSVITRIAYRPFGKKAVPEKGTREYRIISWARHVIRDYISEVLYEERKLSRSTKNIEVIPVVTGRATIDITFNLMARKSKVVRLQDREEKTQKDRAIEYQGKLGHVNIFYFDDEALSGNGLPITRRLKENSILGMNLRVFAADPVPNASMKQWEYKGLTYIGGEERGVADYIDKELHRIKAVSQRPALNDPNTNIAYTYKSAGMLKELAIKIAQEFGLGEILEIGLVAGGGGAASKMIPKIRTVKGEFAIKQLKGAKNENEAIFVMDYVKYLIGYGIPVPAVYKTNSTGRDARDFITKFDNAETKQKEFYTVDRWITGRKINREDASPSTLKAVGRMLGKIHAASRAFAGSQLEHGPNNYTLAGAVEHITSPGSSWHAKILKYLNGEEKAIVDETLAQVTDHWNKHSLDEEIGPIQIIPSDMNFANIIFNESGDDIIAVFDWDQVRKGYSAEDLFATLVQTGRPGKVYVGDLRADLSVLLEGWREATGIDLKPKEANSLRILFYTQIMMHLSHMSNSLTGDPLRDREKIELIRGLVIKTLRDLKTAFEGSARTKQHISYIDTNKTLFSDILGKDKPSVLLRIPIEAIESMGIDNIKNFLTIFQEAPNGYIELYYMSGTGEAGENIYRKYGLQKKPLLSAFRRTRESTVTLFPAFKGEMIDQSVIVSRLGSIDVTPEDTILSPIGLQHDPAGLIRAAILGLKMMDIARQIKEKGIDITKNQSFKDKIQLDILERLKNVCDIDDLKDFDLSPDDIIALAAGNINNVIAALKKLIRLLPITPIDAEELKQMYEAVKAVVTAA